MPSFDQAAGINGDARVEKIGPDQQAEMSELNLRMTCFRCGIPTYFV